MERHRFKQEEEEEPDMHVVLFDDRKIVLPKYQNRKEKMSRKI